MPNPESHKREITEEEEAMTVASGPLPKKAERRVVANIESIHIAERARDLMHRLATLIPDERTALESAIANARTIHAEPIQGKRGYYTPASGLEDIPYIAGTRLTVELPDGAKMRLMEKSEELLDKQSAEHPSIDAAAHYGLDNKEGLRREWLAYVVDRVFGIGKVPVTILKYGKEGLASQQEWKENIISNKDISEIHDWHDVPGNNMNLQKLALIQALTLNVDAHDNNVFTQKLNEDGLPEESFQGDGSMAMVTNETKDIFSSAWSSMQGKIIKEDLVIKHIDPFFEHPERQELLHEAFRIALGEQYAEKEWHEFMKRVEHMGNTETFPTNERLRKLRLDPPDESPEIWSLDKNKTA